MTLAKDTLASRYRPNRFSDVIGQHSQVTLLTNMIINKSFPKQLLLSGGSGLGKTTLARIIANSLLCQSDFEDRKDAEPCGSCKICLQIAENYSEFPDIIEFDAASYGGKDEIKDIAQKSNFLPMLSRYRIYIIDEAHGLSSQGGQAFLKLLEEPPQHVYFILCTTDPQKMLKTNRGRCVEISLQKPSKADLVKLIKRITTDEEVEVPEWQSNLIAESFDASLGIRGFLNNFEKLIAAIKSNQNLTQIEIRLLLGFTDDSLLLNIFDSIDNGEYKDILSELDNVRKFINEDAIREAFIEWASKKIRDVEPPKLTVYLTCLRDLLDKPVHKYWTDIILLTTTQSVLNLQNLIDTDIKPQTFELLESIKIADSYLFTKIKDSITFADGNFFLNHNQEFTEIELSILRSSAGKLGFPIMLK